ncbi:MAG: signal peptidase I [Chloroflexi bacterium]|nr:signal peptidase I [Chloroflexota bacterium]
MKGFLASKRPIIIVLLIFLAVYGAMHFSLQSFKVEGLSMQPSFHNEEYLVIDKLSYRFGSPGRGHVIVFHNPVSADSPPLIKRIVGLPGETVDIRDGYVYINGQLLKEEPQFGPVPHPGNCPMKIPENHYFVLGDNRTNSTGSHIFGPVPEENIVGRVWLSYWPASEWGLSPRYSATLESVVVASVVLG